MSGRRCWKPPAPVVRTINLHWIAMPRVGPGWVSGVPSNHRQGDNCFCAGEKKGQGKPRSTMVNLSQHTLRGKAECCKHTLCLTSLFGRWVVNGLGYVFYSVSVCAADFACLCLYLTWPCYLVCRINWMCFFLVNTISAFLITDVHQLTQGC